MDGFEASLKALENGIAQVVAPAIDNASATLGKLTELERCEPDRMLGGGAAGSVAFRVTCKAFAHRCGETASGLISSQQALVGTLEQFRSTLRDVVESYRKHELRQTEAFRGELGDG